MRKLSLLTVFILTSIWVANSQNVLFIPPLDTGVWVGDVRTFDLEMSNSTTEFLSGFQTPTSGYNGSFLGPTLYIRKGDEVALNVTNMLGENTTTHWHGLHVPANMDGGPHQMILPGSTWTASFTMLNEASTFWYHPHHKPNFWQDSNGTGGQVFRGLAGMMIVEDENNDTLSIPNTYGIDEIPLIIQDRAFDENGEFIEFLNPSFIGRPGDTVLVNGVVSPSHITFAQMIRFRILNASNTRTYYLGISDDRNFYQIASDGGFLETPNLLNRLRISPGERVELVIDFSGDEGQSVDLMSFASELNDIQPIGVPLILDDLDLTNYRIMSFDVGSPTSNPSPVYSLAPILNSIPLYNELDADTIRSFVLSNGPPLSINGVTMDLNVINEVVPLWNMEVWTITNPTGVAHPFHIHGQQFQVLERSDGPVPESEKGWKDVVFVPFHIPGQPQAGWVRVIKRFDDFSDSNNPYMYHCHILEHEDNGMMGQFTVVDNEEVVASNIEELKLMTYNVGSTNWITTRDSVIARIQMNNPDVIALHEAGQNRRPFIEASLSEYQMLQTFGGNPNMSATHIFYDPTDLVVVDSGMVQVETYEGYPGQNRYINWARFSVLSNGDQFVYYATHFVSTIGGGNTDSAIVGQYRNAIAIIDLMIEHQEWESSYVIGGDLNANINTDVIQYLLGQNSLDFDGLSHTNPIELFDSWDIANPNIAKPTTLSIGLSNTAIDWLLVSGDLDITHSIIDNLGVNADGIAPSDHYPVIATIASALTSEVSEQTLVFFDGWNMISTYMSAENMGVDLLFSSLVDSIIIIKDNVGAAYLPDWSFNGIGDLEVGQGYQLKIVGDHDLVISGVNALPEENPVQLNEGWNLIGYLPLLSRSTEDVLNDIIEVMIILKDNVGNVVLPDFDYDSVVELVPGQGYQIKMTDESTLLYNPNDP